MISYNFKHIFLNLLKENNFYYGVDATLGNGNDTYSILKYTDAHVTAFDIQEMALESSLEKLKTFSRERYNLILDSHSNMDRYLKDSPDLIVFNTGYLPGSDKKIITDGQTLTKALEISVEVLKPNGIIFFAQYIGHEGSFEESEITDGFFKNLCQKKFRVLKNEFYNQINNPPIVYLAEKL